jgi:AsmA protein
MVIAATQSLEKAPPSVKPGTSEGGDRLRAGGKTFGRGQTVIPRGRLSRGALALALVVLAAAAAILALPYIASNRIVSDRIALEMSDWSGYAVSIGAAPQIHIWPDFEAVLTDVSLRPKDAADGPPVVESERIEIELSPLAALSGEVVFHSARLVRPVLFVRETAAGHLLPAPPGGGRIARAMDGARDVVRGNAGDREAAELPADLLGSVEFVDGAIVADGAELVSGLAGKVDWPALNRPGFVKAEGFWRGEAVALDIASSSPLTLLVGGRADLSASLRSAPASFRFEGTATLADEPSFQGQGKFLAPSLRRFLEWSDAGAGGGAPSESLAVESRISGNAKRVRFEEATVAVGDVTGSGVIDLVVAGGRPAVSGTLAFGSLDLGSLVSALTPAASSPGTEPVAFPREFADAVSLDLRVSASSATFGKIALSDVAATARVSEEGAAFDISDAAAFGGGIQAGIRFRRNAGETDLEMRLLASEIDGGAFGAAAGMSGLMPIGRGNVSVILSGPGRTWQSFPGEASGSISMNFGPGALPGIDLQRFLGRVAKGGFFALGEVAGGTLPVDAAELKATVSGGAARIDKAEARWASARLLLSGVVSFQSRGLALSGSIGPAAGPVQRFFVGGSWTAPYITPVPGSPAE